MSTHPPSMLRHTPRSVLWFYITGPIVGVVTLTAIIGIATGGGVLAGRTWAKPVEVTEVSINEPQFRDRVPNNDLNIKSLVCTGDEGTLRITFTSRRIDYLTVNGPNEAEWTSWGNSAVEIPVEAGTYDLSYSGESSRLSWQTRGDISCKQTVSSK
ncbi:hypothetical protein [Brevibacterium aurantiacum]|uniref:Uncharacterized protein n=1 Tax=Brevibacterium aurantiacum TaxID=273384 RepID=A0A556C355_BREAU|nr:hypothetical protein [Brevibacterium aurantiacum]TSI11894.1 hypothetical protein FO013_21520 [Brevibacterium aurantiacum]